MMRQQKILRLPTKSKLYLKKIPEYYLNYGFIEQVIHILKPSLYNIIGGHELFNKTMKRSKLLHYMEPNNPVLKDKPLEFLKSKKKKKKNRNMKNRNNYRRPPLHQMHLTESIILSSQLHY